MSPRHPAARTAAAIAVVAALSCIASCTPAGDDASANTELVPLKVVDIAYMDTTVNACTDFFQYSNGGWLATDTIPAAYSSTGVARDMADRIDSIITRSEFIPAVARLQMEGSSVLFRYSPSVNSHDTEHYIASVDRGGLGLPDRDYYVKTGASADSTRREYVAHIARMFVLAGADSARAASDAARVLAVETEMAKAQLPRVARRDPKAVDHPMNLAQLAGEVAGERAAVEHGILR